MHRHRAQRGREKAEAGRKIVAVNPTCSMMMRREYPELVAPEDEDRAQTVAEAIVDPSELVGSIRKEEHSLGALPEVTLSAWAKWKGFASANNGWQTIISKYPGS
jgi:Fe-S oxidoreductase